MYSKLLSPLVISCFERLTGPTHHGGLALAATKGHVFKLLNLLNTAAHIKERAEHGETRTPGKPNLRVLGAPCGRR